jgi:hypothetical protein
LKSQLTVLKAHKLVVVRLTNYLSAKHLRYYLVRGNNGGAFCFEVYRLSVKS